jgi:hypothetical protein
MKVLKKTQLRATRAHNLWLFRQGPRSAASYSRDFVSMAAFTKLLYLQTRGHLYQQDSSCLDM